jgi:hypothetical protein
MALLTNHYIDRNFKVVEINNSVALRSGHVIAQARLVRRTGSQWETPAFVENGFFFNMDVDGELKAPGNVANAALKLNQNPILHYTEELLTGPITDLKYFAEIWQAEKIGNTTFDVCYPRGLVLGVGDTFTTNNFTGDYAAGVAILTAAGQLSRLASVPATIAGGYVGPLFNVIPSTLPDGDTNALEVTYLGNITIAAAN